MKMQATPNRNDVSAAPALALQRKCACGENAGPTGECEECRQKRMGLVQRCALGTGQPSVTPLVHQVLASPGRPLDAATRAFMEPRFGHDFSRVRVHTDRQAAKSAQAINARAYTVGENIVFNAGAFSPGTSGGRRLLAHELTHTVQQGLREPRGESLTIMPDNDRLEREADSVASSVLDASSHMTTFRTGTPPTLSIQRQCLTGPVCSAPIPGDPGRYSEQVIEEEEPARGTRTRRPREARRLGHGREATNLERLAEENGIHLGTGGIGDIVVDLDMASGASLGWCDALEGDPTPYEGDRNNECVFVSNDLEVEAQAYYRDPRQDTIDTAGGAIDTEVWVVQALQTIIHETQHHLVERLGLGSGAGSCTTATEIHRGEGSRSYTVSYYLSELSAIISEFPVLFRAAHDSTRPALRDEYNSWFADAVNSPDESIRGILTTLRCRCDCDQLDNWIRDIFDFTAASWSQGERNAFHSTLQLSFPDLNWPIYATLPQIERRAPVPLREDYSGHTMAPQVVPAR